MADDFVVNPGAGGDIFAADEIAGVKHQRVKIEYGVDGSATEVSDTNPLPVDDAGGSLTVDDGGGSLTVDGPLTDAQMRATPVPVADGGGSLTVDGTVSVSGAVDTELTIADLDTGAGTDMRAVVGLVGAASGGGQLIPGSAADGLLVNLGTNNDVTVTGTVTANAGAGPFPVSDNGGSLTIDGTVTVIDGGGTISIDDGAGSITVDGSVSITGSVAVTNAGTFAVQDSEKVVDNAGFTDGTTKVQPAGFVFDEVAGTALTENDAAAARIDSKRAQVLVIEDETTRGRRVTVTAGNALKVDGSAVTQPISAASLPLPTGAATSANQSTMITSLQLLDDVVYASGGSVTKGIALVAHDAPSGFADVLHGTSNSLHVYIQGSAGTLSVNTELNTPAALADAASATVSTATVGAVPLLMNATTVDRARAVINGLDSSGIGIAASGIVAQLDDVATGAVTENQFAPVRMSSRRALLVEGVAGGTALAISGSVTNAGTFAVQENGAALTALQLIDDAVFTDDAAFTPGTSKGLAVGFQADETSPDAVNEGDFGVPRMTLDRIAIVTVRPNATGEGLDIFRSIDLDETEEDVKTTAGKVYGWFMFNGASSVRYIKFYNATAANVTVGTTTPVLTIPLPAGAAANVEFTNGIPFSTAICVAATTGVADSDTGAPGANEVVVNIFYK